MTKLLFILIISSFLLGNSVHLYNVKYLDNEIEINKKNLRYISKNNNHLIFRELTKNGQVYIIDKENIKQVFDLQAMIVVDNYNNLNSQIYLVEVNFKTSTFLKTLGRIVVGYAAVGSFILVTMNALNIFGY